MRSKPPHLSVLRREVVEFLNPRDGEVFVDGTFGAGGYSRAILDAAKCTVYGIDRDPTVASYAAAVTAAYGDRFHFLPGRFGDMIELLGGVGVSRVDGVVLDLGVSSMQLDEAARGFSFQADGPLDMRMGREGPSAADLVNSLSAEKLADLIYKYGEERHSRRIARAIVAVRADRPITRTGELAKIVERAVPGHQAIHPATRTFQALRISVNDELGELEGGLAAAERLIGDGGRLIVVSFHSLEDRIVKAFLRQRSGEVGGPSRHRPNVALTPPSFTLMTKKAVRPSEEEAALNPRARSARLRAARRTAAAPWPVERAL
ncbi:MAG: 16S rRNA (cytosine(1402)-N(4))-methyltransferase [Proteobacteria bacterium]|nr:MAG: 16S rRNA (cytosine(1402)-N(4))-methyltransferase [Pseudomonadota bacterium]